MSAEPFIIDPMAGRSSVDKSDKLDLRRCLALLEHFRATDRSAALTDGQVTARWSTEAKELDDKAQASWDMAINILKRLTGPNPAP